MPDKEATARIKINKLLEAADYVALNQFAPWTMNPSRQRFNCGEFAIVKPVEFDGFGTAPSARPTS